MICLPLHHTQAIDCSSLPSPNPRYGAVGSGLIPLVIIASAGVLNQYERILRHMT